MRWMTLRQKAQAAAAKHAGRATAEGRFEVYVHSGGRIGVMVEVNTETDFAARSEAVGNFAHEVALQVAASAPLFVGDEDIPAETLRQEGEGAAGRARNEGKPEALIGAHRGGHPEKVPRPARAAAPTLYPRRSG